MPRYRVSADIVTKDGKPMTSRHFQQLHEAAWTLVNVAGTHEMEGIDADLRVVEVVSVHPHESTDDRQCQFCREAAADGWNSDTTPTK